MRRVLVGVIAVIALAYVGVGAFFWGVQGSMIFPAPRVPREALDHMAETLGVSVVHLQADDGTRLYAWHRPVAGPEGARKAVVFLHGNAETVADRPELHALLHAAGWEVLVPAYRGYPGSEGTPSEAGLVLDAQAAVGWLEEERGVPPERIVVHGKSLGGGVAAALVEGHPVGGLVLESTFTAIADVARRTLPVYPVRLLLRHRFETLRRAPHLDLPTLVLHGTADRMIPVAHARANAAALPDATLVEVDGAGHGETLPQLDPAARAAYLALLSRVADAATTGAPAP